MNPIIMHINFIEPEATYLKEGFIDRACSVAAEIGYDGVEFRGKVPVQLGNITFEEYAGRIAKAKEKYGLAEILFRFDLPECDEEEVTRISAISEIIRKVEVAKNICGTKLCNTTGKKYASKITAAPVDAHQFHGSAVAEAEQWKLTAESYSQVGKALEKIGVKFAFETHMGYIHDLPAESKKLVDMIGSPAIGINMDYGNTVYFPEPPSAEETIDIYGEKLFYVHLKNSRTVPGDYRRIPTALSDGEINHRTYLSKLLSSGFSGFIGIEAPRGGDRVAFAKEDFCYLKSLLKQ